MRITEITQQVKNPNRYNVFIDGEFAFGISGTDLLYYKLEIGAEIDAVLREKLSNELEYIRARDYAVRVLGRGPKSLKEMADKLRAKECSTDITARVIELLEKNRYLDDFQFSVSFITQKSKINNYGKKRIIAELLNKGVSRENILAAYKEVFDETEKENETQAARRALLKKLRGRDIKLVLADVRELKRITGFLARRGFSYDVIKSVLTNDLYCCSD